MNRLSDKYTVLFIEEPGGVDADHEEGSVTIEKINENLTVLTPHLHWTDWKVMCPQYFPILEKYVEGINESLIWVYSPFYIYILNTLQPSMVVYDCMDELSAFKNASTNLPAYEKQVIGMADVIFTGGKSLYEAKKELHPHVYCFPSSVDRDHFARAADETTAIPEDLLAIEKPIVGFYGVIDERLDFDLLKSVAEKMPEVSFVMIGPFVKIEMQDAAQAENIFYLGKREYALLPNYLKGMDVAMMPFAMNEATRFISPTKTLEFMAAEKPIVSTPIYDVVRDYSHVVAVARDAQDFANLIQKFLTENDEEKERRQEAQQAIIEGTSWVNTVKEMENIIIAKRMSIESNGTKASAQFFENKQVL
jgi:glycosyltransferase involved in cell wall biosynthesis